MKHKHRSKYRLSSLVSNLLCHLLVTFVINKQIEKNVHNYHVCPSLLLPPSLVHYPVLSHLTIPAVRSQNITNKSCLVCVQSEKYASWVNLTSQLDRCCRGEAEVRILDFKTIWSDFQMPSQITTDKAKLRYMFRVSSPPQSRSKAVVCVSTPRMYPRSGYFLVMPKERGALIS